MNSNTEIKPSAAEPAETSEQQKFRMSPVMTEAYTQMLAAADEVEKVVVGKRTEVVLLLTALLAGARCTDRGRARHRQDYARRRTRYRNRVGLPPGTVYARRHGIGHHRLQYLQSAA